MRHGHQGRKFGRRINKRKALLSGLASSLIRYEQIRTTLPKAKDLRPIVERLVTLGKKGTLAARRQAISYLRDPELAQKLMGNLSPRYQERAGGYLRIMKAGFRQGDMAAMAIIEFVDRDPSAKPKKAPEVEGEESQTLEASAT